MSNFDGNRSSFIKGFFLKTFFSFFGLMFASAVLFAFSAPAEAAITESGPPIFDMFKNVTLGAGANTMLAKFMLVGDSSTTLTKVGFTIRASSTMDNLTQISGVALYRESGTSFGFNPKEDIYMAGTYTTSGGLSTTTMTILQPTGGYAVPAQNTEFFIVASTSAAANIVNNNAFDILMVANYASTSAGAIGSAPFESPKKFILEKNIPVKISEVKAGTAVNGKDEFVEIYNPNEYYINPQVAGLALHGFSAAGGATNFALTYSPGKAFIAPFGYYLLTSATSYSGSVPADATFDNLATDVLVANGGLSLATSTSVASATSTKIDMLCYGTHPAANCENAGTTGTIQGAALTENGTSLERVAQGYPAATSTAADLASGGSHAMKGNGVDNDDNSADFVAQATANPQNSTSPTEFPFGAGVTDVSSPSVGGSYPNSGMTNVPADMTFIGFGFSEPIDSGTIVSNTSTSSVSLTASGSSTNLCSSVTYNPMPTNFEPPAKCVLSSALTANTTYTFEVGTSTGTAKIRDLTGNQLDQDGFQAGIQSYRITFTTGGSGQAMTNVAPPNVTGSMPFPGSFNIPTNITKFFITFSQTMNSATLNSNTIRFYSRTSGVETQISLAGATFSYDATTSVLTISGLPSLSDNTNYEIHIGGGSTGVKSSNNVELPMSSWMIPFTTGTADTSAPTVLGTVPVQSGATNVPLNTVAFILSFSDHMDLSTATSGAVTLAIDGGATLPSTFSYDPVAKEGILLATNLLPAGQNMIITAKGGSLKNVSGTAMGTDYTVTFSTEGSNSDSTGPTLVMASADDFAVAATFNEAVNSSDAVSLSNYSISSGGQSITLSGMAGHSIAYNAARRTAKISGIKLQAGSSFSITATNIKDITGNATASSTVSGTVMSFANTGGMIDPGMGGGGSIGAPPPPKTFSSGGVSGFMPPANIMVMNNMVSASTTYGFEIPISTQIPADGQIVITFPSTSDFGLCCAATSSTNAIMLNDLNRDINGPGTGTVGIKTITKDNQAKTVTLTLDAATRSENSDTHDFLRFGLTDIKNPSIAKGADTNGYSLDIKTRAADGTTILESSFNVNPVYIGGGNIGGGATTTLQGQVFSGYDGTTGLNGVNVMVQSPILGPMPRIVSTSGTGNFSFTNLPANNDYFLFTEPTVSPSGTTTGYFGFNQPAPIRATSTSVLTKNLSLTATTSAVSLTIKLTAAVSTFTATEKLDIFAGGSGQFTVQTVTPGASALTAATMLTLSLPQQNGMWFVGIGPAMPKDGMMMGPPPAPAWVMPKPLELNMSGCPSACSLTEAGLPKTTHTFSVSAANKTIAGIVKDASGTVLTNTEVYAFSPSQRIGTRGQTDTAGKFSLSVVEGLYNVGAFFPGMGQSKEVAVEVTSAASNYVFVDGSKTASTGQTGTNPFILTIKKPAYTITGKVGDGTNNIANAPVFAYRTDGPGHADAMTDSSGNYTLYVDNGSWRVNAHVPGYGQMTEQAVTISGANQSGINFAPSGSTNYWMVTGTVFESADATIDASEGIANVIVAARASDTGRIYDTKTGSDGVYSLRVPQLATTTGQYILDVFKPGYGKIAPLTEGLTAIPRFGIVATTTWNVRVNTRNTVTVNFKDTAGNFITVPEAFIDLFDVTKNSGNHAEVRNGTSTTLQIPNTSSTTVRVFIPAVPQNSISYATDTAATTFYDSANTILNVDGNETIKVVVNANLRTISGTIYHTSATAGNELKDVWVDVINTSNGMHYGVSATSSAGTYSINLADGSYKISAAKPGYIMTPQALTVSGNATQNLIMTSAAYTIGGSVTAGGSAAPYAFVRAEKTTGGTAVTQADASGSFTLSVDPGSWKVYAASETYTEAAYASNPIAITSSNVSGVSIALTSAASIQSALATSPTFKDTSAGSFEDTTVKTKVTIDSGALGQSGSDSYITAKETVNYPNTSSITVIASKAKDISAYSGSSQVKDLSSGKKATIELSYTVAELATSGIDTPTEVSQLSVSTINEQKEWESLSTVATYKDSNGNAVAVATTSASIPGTVSQVTFTTNEATHFSPYALTQASDPTAPSTPTGLTATAVSATRIDLSWTANSDSDLSGYYVYRDTSSGGSFPQIASVSTNSYSNTGLSGGTTYYYKIAAYDTAGFESTSTDAVSARTASAEGGGVISSGGGGGGGSVPTPVYTVIPGTDSSSSQSSSQAVSSSESSSVSGQQGATVTRTIADQTITQTVSTPSGVTVAITRTLKIGMENSEVRNLQELLALDPEVYPEAKVTGYYGSLTKKAVKAFQKKHGIASGGDENTTGYGLVGPKTLAKIKEVFGATQSVSDVVKPVETPSAATAVLTKLLKQGMEGDEVVILQELLARDPEVYPEAKVTGYYGSLTKKAVTRFQQKYGLEPVGHVGPMTRTKLMELYSPSTNSGQVPTGSGQAANQTESQSQNPATEQNSGSGQGSNSSVIPQSQPSVVSSASSVDAASQPVSSGSGSGSGGSGGAGVGQSSPAQTDSDQQIQQLIDQINTLQSQINALQ